MYPLALLDAASLYFRSFFALPESLRAPDGTPVNAVRGFADVLARILTDRQPVRLAACLDADWRPRFRVAAWSGYKAHRVAETSSNGPDREDMPAALEPQVPMIQELLAALGIATARAEGFEADDVIGTLTAHETTTPVEIVTGDRDLFQLVRSRPSPTSVIYTGKGWAKADILTPTQISTRYGLPEDTAGPAYADLAMLRGDSSDGLPGVPGIGEKTAAKLITQFGSFEGLLAAAQAESSALPTHVHKKLAENTEYLRAAPLVVRVVPDAPVVLSGDDTVPHRPDQPERVTELVQRWNLGGSGQRLLEAMANLDRTRRQND